MQNQRIKTLIIKPKLKKSISSTHARNNQKVEFLSSHFFKYPKKFIYVSFFDQFFSTYFMSEYETSFIYSIKVKSNESIQFEKNAKFMTFQSFRTFKIQIFKLIAEFPPHNLKF